jgi:Glutathione-dependent formaldehyde-activating enzyme
VRRRTLWHCAWAGSGAAGMQQHGVLRRRCTERVLAGYRVEGGAGTSGERSGRSERGRRGSGTIMAAIPGYSAEGTRPSPRDLQPSIAEAIPPAVLHSFSPFRKLEHRELLLTRLRLAMDQTTRALMAAGPGAAQCHCLQCQRRTGSTYGIAAFFRRENVTVAGERRRQADAPRAANEVAINPVAVLLCSTAVTARPIAMARREPLFPAMTGAGRAIGGARRQSRARPRW